MKVKEFLEQVQQLLRTTGDEEFEFENPSEMSMFLYGFRTPSRHNGNYVDGVWHMARPEGKPQIEMKISRGSTVISRRVLIEVANIVTDEVNDMLLCEFGPDAKLHEYICVDGPTPQGRTGGFCCNGKLKRENVGWLVAFLEISLLLAALLVGVRLIIGEHIMLGSMVCSFFVARHIAVLRRKRNGWRVAVGV